MLGLLCVRGCSSTLICQRDWRCDRVASPRGAWGHRERLISNRCDPPLAWRRNQVNLWPQDSIYASAVRQHISSESMEYCLAHSVQLLQFTGSEKNTKIYIRQCSNAFIENEMKIHNLFSKYILNLIANFFFALLLLYYSWSTGKTYDLFQ